MLLRTVLASFLLLPLGSCSDDTGPHREDASPEGGPRRDAAGFFCVDLDTARCIDGVYNTCELVGEFLQPVREDCTAHEPPDICVEGFGCVVCRPGSIGCFENDVARCADDGSAWIVEEECNIDEGEACRDGQCRNFCELAIEDRSYVGCDFFAADLDNASLALGRDASAQQYAIVVSNPGTLSTEVWVEINDAEYGEDADVVEVERVTLLPGDLEILNLPRREVDGSSSNTMCFPADRTCPGDEVCVCSSMDTGPPCFCRVSRGSSGMNDGTHSRVSSQAYRVRSVLPIIAYQFNPLDNVGVFSNDASLLLPTSAIGPRYTVVGWPQTIANGDDPERDFDPTRDDEDLRATLTIIGTADGTDVNIRLGRRVVKLVGYEDLIPEVGGDADFSLTIDAFDVINLETEGLNGDFTGTVVDATHPVTVFVGSEASDVPRFDTYATRQCCADHLEEQLFPDESLGSSFIIARMPPRTVALNRAFLDPLTDSVAEVNEPEWVRVVAVANGTTNVTTTLPPPDDRFSLRDRESIILRADQDFMMFTEDAAPLAVLQALPSQEAVGIPNFYPGGDPAIIAVPPEEQFRQDYVFLTPDLYAFDFVVIVGERETVIELDGASLDPLRCTTSPADGIVRLPGDPPPEKVIHRCQLSFPDVIGLPSVMVEDGDQDDGVHTIVADRPVGIVVYGFDSFVSYAYAAGLNLKPIPR